MRSDKGRIGLATPVSLSFLLFSLLLIILTTYYFAVSTVETKSEKVKYIAAKNAMLTLEGAIRSILWTPDSSIVQIFQDYDGKFEVKPTGRYLVINLTLGSLDQTIFNGNVGFVRYILPPATVWENGVFIRGDSRTIVNSSTAGMTQLFIRIGDSGQEVILSYRPYAVSYTNTLGDSNTIENVIRVYLITLNYSENLILQGKFRVKVRCLSVHVATKLYNLSNIISSAHIVSSIDGETGTLILPLRDSGNFTYVRVEVVTCNIKLKEVRE